MASRNWVCPFCNRPQTLTDGQYSVRETYINLKEHKYGNIGLQTIAYACANPECGEVALTAYFTRGQGSWDNFSSKSVLEIYELRPQGAAKPQPEYIPSAIREDYVEACRIRNLSPKASATLARRCLQGMIRDFCEIVRPTLFKEIEALRRALDDGTAARGVTHESVDAIDAVRSVGNIGAHMEQDVDLIVEIDPGEAQMLIDLIEMLFMEWYTEREKRARRLAEITALSAKKASELETLKLAKLASGPAIPESS
jgi:hypothetical protein